MSIKNIMPRTIEQNEQIRLERINIIMTSAMYLFATKGYDSTTLDEIAKDSGCSHGLLYHYFKNKNGIYDHLIDNVVFPMMHNLVNSIDFKQKAKFVLYDLLNVLTKALKSEDDQYAWAINLLISLDLSIVEGTKSTSVSKAKNKKVFSWISSTIERGQTEGDFNKEKIVREVAASLLCFIKGLAYSRTRLGHKKFICPNIQIPLSMVY